MPPIFAVLALLIVIGPTSGAVVGSEGPELVWKLMDRTHGPRTRREPSENRTRRSPRMR
ncbi:hypothetical protein [Methanopyrus sp.]